MRDILRFFDKFFVLTKWSIGIELFSLKSRDVAQSGSAPEWGSGSRRFKSCRPDHDHTNLGRSGPMPNLLFSLISKSLSSLWAFSPIKAASTIFATSPFLTTPPFWN